MEERIQTNEKESNKTPNLAVLYVKGVRTFPPIESSSNNHLFLISSHRLNLSESMAGETNHRVERASSSINLFPSSGNNKKNIQGISFSSFFSKKEEQNQKKQKTEGCKSPESAQQLLGPQTDSEASRTKLLLFASAAVSESHASSALPLCVESTEVQSKTNAKTNSGSDLVKSSESSFKIEATRGSKVEIKKETKEETKENEKTYDSIEPPLNSTTETTSHECPLCGAQSKKKLGRKSNDQDTWENFLVEKKKAEQRLESFSIKIKKASNDCFSIFQKAQEKLHKFYQSLATKIVDTLADEQVEIEFLYSRICQQEPNLSAIHFSQLQKNLEEKWKEEAGKEEAQFQAKFPKTISIEEMEERSQSRSRSRLFLGNPQPLVALSVSPLSF